MKRVNGCNFIYGVLTTQFKGEFFQALFFLEEIMDKKEKIENLKELTEKGISLSELVEILGINNLEVMGLIRELRLDGINIVIQNRDDDIYLFNQGERELSNDNQYKFYTDDNNEFKFVAISDTRLGSKSQQLSILNDIYTKASDLGFHNVILCGNISEGLYPLNNIYSEENFLDDTLQQVDYITQYYPYIDGITTYFITGTKDEKKLSKQKRQLFEQVAAGYYVDYNTKNMQKGLTRILKK